MTSWDEALDAFGARLDEQREAMARGRAGDVPPFAPSSELGPLPEGLRHRAEALLQEAAELRAELELTIAAAARETTMIRRLLADHGRPGSARFVDRGI